MQNSKINLPNQQFLNPSQVCETYGVKLSALYKATSTGEIKFSKPFGNLVFIADDVETWLAKRIEKTTRNPNKKARS
jgi:predicted DNA-binding transcriptional regulator AlpA